MIDTDCSREEREHLDDSGLDHGCIVDRGVHADAEGFLEGEGVAAEQTDAAPRAAERGVARSVVRLGEHLVEGVLLLVVGVAPPLVEHRAGRCPHEELLVALDHVVDDVERGPGGREQLRERSGQRTGRAQHEVGAGGGRGGEHPDEVARRRVLRVPDDHGLWAVAEHVALHDEPGVVVRAAVP